MKSVSIVILLLMWSSLAHSVNYKKSESLYSEDVDALLTFLSPNLMSRPKEERKILNKVVVTLHPNLLQPHEAMALVNPNHRLVLLSDSFIDGLWRYTEALYIEQKFNIPHFRERYMNYYLWRTTLVYKGAPPKKPFAWSGLMNQEVKKYRETVGAMANAALVDVLLHEIGHHATLSLYSQFASNTTKRAYETKADKWAFEVGKKVFEGNPNVVGRLIAMGFIFELNRWTMNTGRPSHPTLASRVKSSFKSLCAGNQQQHGQLCSFLHDEIDKYEKYQNLSLNRRQEIYQKRALQGEEYAYYVLGNISLSFNDPKEACDNFVRAPAIPRANVQTGWCYEKGFLPATSLEGAKKVAEVYYRSGVKSGFTDAQRYLENLQ